MIQDLLLHDPADKVPLKAVMDYYKHPVPRCKLDDKLEYMFDKLRKGDSHLAFVYDKENYEKISDENEIVEALGIVTLENIIEALVQGDIMDEADTKRERRKKRSYLFSIL
jgi:CBS domain containing-hemolysin-like protein